VALIVLGRSGTAITVELANMTVMGETRQLRRMGIDPFRHVIFPRLIGVTSATLLLGFFYGFMIILTAAIASKVHFHIFLTEYMKNVSLLSMLIFTEKLILFGLIISTVACYQGLSLVPVTTDVPKATIRTVIHCIVICVVFDFLLSISLVIGF